MKSTHKKQIDSLEKLGFLQKTKHGKHGDPRAHSKKDLEEQDLQQTLRNQTRRSSVVLALCHMQKRLFANWKVSLALRVLGNQHRTLTCSAAGKNSQEICSIALSHGKCCCVRLPQGLSCSPDVLQENTDSILSGAMEKVFYCVDKILLATHDGFDAHLQQLELVLLHLNEHNLQVRAEEPFLEETHFDCFGIKSNTQWHQIIRKESQRNAKHQLSKNSSRIMILCTLLKSLWTALGRENEIMC